MTVVVNPSEPILVIDEDDIARRIGLIETPPTTVQVAIIRDAIIDAQDDVHAYLGVPLAPVASYRDFNPGEDYQPFLDGFAVVTATTYEPLASGAVRVRVVHGYDARNDPTMTPVRRYIRYAALAQPGVIQLWAETSPKTVQRRTKSASTDGQSISYEYLAPDGRTLAEVAKSNVPDISSLDYWRVAGRRVVQRRGPGSDPLPMDGYGSGGWRPWGGI